METAYFQEYVKLAQCGSFTAAARDMHLTQSTLSKHIAALEREFGTDLFIRDRSGIKLTEAGKALYSQAAKLELVMQQTRQVMEAAQQTVSEVPITYTDSIRDTALRCKCSYLAKRYDLNQKETGALILYLEERGLAEIQKELDLSRDEVADVLGGVYRKLGTHGKQEVLDLIYSISE